MDFAADDTFSTHLHQQPKKTRYTGCMLNSNCLEASHVNVILTNSCRTYLSTPVTFFYSAENGIDVALELLKKSVKDVNISKASSEELTAALTPSLTEDIFEIELLHTQKSYPSLGALQQQTVDDISCKAKVGTLCWLRTTSFN